MTRGTPPAAWPRPLARGAILTLALFTALILSPSRGFAQVRSQLTGTVTDERGGAVFGAKLTLTNIARGIAYSTESNGVGIYLFLALTSGDYELTCEFPGFKKVVRTGLTLETGFIRTVNVELRVGEISETITVRGGAPLIETESSTVGQLIVREMIENMPLESRRAGSLARLAGAVRFVVEFGPRQIPSFRVGGGESDQMWHLDGGSVQDTGLEFAQLALNPPLESIEEFKVAFNGYSAEFGRTGSGQIIMTTRSGTNEFHGSVYEFFRHEVLDARTFFTPEKAPLRYNIFGASLGGPVSRNRTFFFLNYEGARRRDAFEFTNQEVPHPREIEGDFSSRGDLTVVDPLAKTPFPNNIIPPSRIDPVGLGFARFYPKPNVADNDVTRAPRDNYSIAVSSPLTQDSITGRLDHVLGSKDRAFLRLSYQRAPFQRGGPFPDARVDFLAFNESNRLAIVSGAWLHSTASVLHEVRYTFGDRIFTRKGSGAGSGINRELGLSGVNPESSAAVFLSGLPILGSIDRRGYPLAWTTRYMLWSDLELPPTSRRYGTGSTCTAF